MYTFLSVVYVLVCSFLIMVVLLQQGRGGGMGSLGGGSQTVFGGSGAGNLLTRLTTVSAALFMILSATLAWLSSSGDSALEDAMHQREDENRAELHEALESDDEHGRGDPESADHESGDHDGEGTEDEAPAPATPLLHIPEGLPPVPGAATTGVDVPVELPAPPGEAAAPALPDFVLTPPASAPPAPAAHAAPAPAHHADPAPSADPAPAAPADPAPPVAADPTPPTP